MFQSVLEQHEPDKSRTASRRELGAHYTSERNILRAINPLFMDDLRAELKAVGVHRSKQLALYEKLPKLRIFDPACGCGNFLVIAYRELRRLEMDLIAKLFKQGQQIGGIDRVENLSRVHVGQFYGIEIDPSAAHIAQVAMWITDHQMNLEAAKRFGTTRPSVPLVQSAHVHQGNALRTDWADILPPEQCSFIVGNPPFVGGKYQSEEQREDAALVLDGIGKYGLLDYVACWHVKAARYMKGHPEVACALVSTNSLCQGEQVGVLWPYLLSKNIGMHIQFAHRTFQWSNEGRGVAAVHCIIVGFGPRPAEKSVVYDYSGDIKAAEGVHFTVKNLNPYLVDGPNVVLTRRGQALCEVPEMGIGNKPIDDGYYLFTPEEKAAFVAAEPASAAFFRRWIGADEFLNEIERWCLWLGDVAAGKLAKLPKCRERIAAVRKFRAESKSVPTQKLAETPTRFHVEFMPKKNYLVVPEVSSARRRFIPIGFIGPEVLSSNLLRIVPDASLYHLGVLSSSQHNAWMRTVAGRLKSDYRYSIHIVYNNFPWPESPTEKARKAVEDAAQAVIAARQTEMQREAGTTLAMLYNPDTMPAALTKAHVALDKAVDAAYGYTGKKDDASRVTFLFERFEKLTSPKPVEGKARKTKTKESAET